MPHPIVVFGKEALPIIKRGIMIGGGVGAGAIVADGIIRGYSFARDGISNLIYGDDEPIRTKRKTKKKKRKATPKVKMTTKAPTKPKRHYRRRDKKAATAAVPTSTAS